MSSRKRTEEEGKGQAVGTGADLSRQKELEHVDANLSQHH